jgi:hypothetical protein
MKNVVIPIENNSIAKLLMELAKKMGLEPRIESRKEMEWNFMPDDDKVLEKMMDDAEKNFSKGKFLSAEQAKNIVRKWK